MGFGRGLRSRSRYALLVALGLLVIPSIARADVHGSPPIPEPCAPDQTCLRTWFHPAAIGPGLFLLTSPATGAGPLWGGVALQFRNAYLLAEHAGLTWSVDILLHDWEAMGGAYGWYFDDSATMALKLTTLGAAWPFLPLGGSNFATSFGVTLLTSRSMPALYFDTGVTAALLLRPSRDDFLLDLGLGPYVALGFDFTRSFGIGLRAGYTLPVFHTLLDLDPWHAFTFQFTLNMPRY